MQQVKIFDVSYPSELESEMNEWLKDNPDVNVIAIYQHSNIRVDYFSTGYICNHHYEYTAIVHYQKD